MSGFAKVDPNRDQRGTHAIRSGRCFVLGMSSFRDISTKWAADDLSVNSWISDNEGNAKKQTKESLPDQNGTRE